MNREQQRFELIKHLAGAAMPSEGFNPDYVDWPKIKGDLAKCCVEIADALLSELDRTKPEPETPQPDADGWIPHRPGDPMPCDGEMMVFTMFQDGELSTESYHAKRLCWTAINVSFAIIAWKPA